MAAAPGAAGVPGSGEGGGEAEADSDPIPGVERPAEAAVGAGCIPGQLGSEEVSSPWAEGLRKPEEERVGPEGAEAPVGNNIKSSEMDSGDCRLVGSPLLPPQEEPMQLGKDLVCPPASCHAGPSPLGPVCKKICEAAVEISSSKMEILSDFEVCPSASCMEDAGTLSPKNLDLQPVAEEQDGEGSLCSRGSPREKDPTFKELHSEMTSPVSTGVEGMELTKSHPTPVFEELRPSQHSPNLEESRSSPSLPDLELTGQRPTPLESNSSIDHPSLCGLQTMKHPEATRHTPHHPVFALEETVLSPSKPASEIEELALSPLVTNLNVEQPASPQPNTGQERVTPLHPITNLEELASSQSSSNLEELVSSKPHPDLEELAPSKPHPDLEELAPSKPHPDLEELAPSKPHADLEELSPSKPHADLEELSPSKPHADLEELSPSKPHADLEELAPSKPHPDLEDLAPNLKDKEESTSAPLQPMSKPESFTSTLSNSTSNIEGLEFAPSEPNLNLEVLRSCVSHPLPLFKPCPQPEYKEAQEMETLGHIDHLSGNLVQQSKAEIKNLPEIVPLEVPATEISAVKETCFEISVFKEVMDTQEPNSEVESTPMEVVLVGDNTCQVQGPFVDIEKEPASKILPVSEGHNHNEAQGLVPNLPLHAPELLSSVVSSEVDAILNSKKQVCLEHADPGLILLDSLPEGKGNEVMVKEDCHLNSVHLDLIDAKVEHVPEPLPSKIQEFNAVTVEEKVLALGVAAINQEVHPVTGQCAELGVEVKLFLQPVLNECMEGTHEEHLSSGFPLASHNTAFKSEDPSVELVSKVKSVLEVGDSLTPGKETLEVQAVSETAVNSGLSSLDNKHDLKCVDFESKIVNKPDCNENISFAGDVDYDPFYRDFNNERIYVNRRDLDSDTTLEQQQVPMFTPDAAQLKDCHELGLEEPKTSSGMDMCSDNRDRCKGPLAPERGGDPGGIANLVLGSDVQVKLDHIIQDALVVSFRHGDRIFSGVLMDLSKRFGPHGIPVTLHPKREYKSKPEEAIQVQSTSFQEEPKGEMTDENATAPAADPPVQSNEPCSDHNLWTSKPPPLFHEGAPYPPPLFIRDTYNQSIPQPPPRKIKRLKKKIYREEPTSIMNAIKLRPRQVLCDKCKNVVADKKEVRKTGTDSFKLEEGKRRRHDSVTTVNKKLKTEHKVNGKSQNESQKRASVSKVPNIGHGRGKVVKVTSQSSTPKAQLHTKKVLQSKNMDHAKAREVLKMAKEKAQKKQKEASSSKSAHNKVHFTRRLQNTSSGTLPPRLRIKPQRYRNEENDSSLKIGLESLRSNKMGVKPQTRHTATRSAGEAPSEIKSPSNGPQEASGDIQNTSVCVPPGEQDETQALSKRGSKSNITVYMTLNQKKADSSSASVCSSDSTDDLKSTHSECSSTENFDFPPGSMHAPSSSSSSSSKEEKKLSNSLKIKMFSKNVSKCVTPDGRTICVGDIVWAKIYGFPWWPARILTITVSRKDNGLLVRQEARISWFGSPTTSFLALSQLSPFLENFQSRFNKKRKGLYRKAITEAAKAAKQLTPEVRALLTQFET